VLRPCDPSRFGANWGRAPDDESLSGCVNPASESSGDQVTVRLVSRFPVDDLQLSALHARAFGDGRVQVRPWAQRLERYALTWIGAFDNRELIGFVQVCWDGGSHAFLLDTAVDPDRQHQGLGARLVRAAVDEARTAGCEWLHVDFEAHLQPFYLGNCGFRTTHAGLIQLAQE
jgi:GNAT superfamily N-acetyltransferase